MRTHKTTILVLALSLIAAVAICSCNLDATDGIYSEIADSTESTNVTVKAYLGKYNSDYYYLTDSEICKIDDNGNSSTLFSSSETSVIRSASLASDGSLLILRQNINSDGSLIGSTLSYNAFNGTGYDDPAPIEGSFNGLLVNGLFFDSTGIYRYTGGAKSQIETGGNVGVQYFLVNGDYAFFCVTDANAEYKYYVIKASDGTKLFNGITSSIMTYIGFQPLLSGTDFILLNYDSSKAKSNLYVLSNGDTEITTTVYTTLKSSIPYAAATQAASFIYTDAESATYIVFKCSSYFDKVRISDDASVDGDVTQISTGFAANLRTADVTNVLATETDGIFIAGTVDSMLYEINMNEDTSTQKK